METIELPEYPCPRCGGTTFNQHPREDEVGNWTSDECTQCGAWYDGWSHEWFDFENGDPLPTERTA